MFTTKSVIIVLPILLCFPHMMAQVSKPIIDSTVIGTWPTLTGDIQVSADGHYIAYTIRNQPVGKNTIVLQAMHNNWKLERLTDYGYFGSPFYFSTNGQQLLRQHGDSLILEILGKDQPIPLALINGPLLRPDINKNNWMAWHDKFQRDKLVLYNMETSQQQTYPQVNEARFDEKGTVFLIQQQSSKPRLIWVDLSKKLQEKIIWEGEATDTASSFHFDGNSQQLCFLVNQPGGSSICYYQPHMTKAVEKYKASSLQPGWQLAELQGFNSTGRFLLAAVTTKKELYRAPDPNMVAVDVWSYRDAVIHPAQIAHGSAAFSYDKKGLLSIPSGDQPASAKLLNPEGLKMRTVHDYCILSNDTIPPPISSPEYWLLPPPQMWKQPLNSSTRQELPIHQGFYGSSPNGRWLLFWVNERGKRADFYSYEVATGRTFNITDDLPVSVAQEKIQDIDSIPVGIAGWLANDEALLVYDNYDIWQVDLVGKKAPVNLTAGYGFRTHIKLRLVAGGAHGIETVIVNGSEEMMLAGYHEETKYNGFFKLRLSTTGKQPPTLLSMEPFSWFKTDNQVGVSAHPTDERIPPIPAGKGKEQIWVLKGESAMDYPNYYYTRDFQQFTPLTQLAPQKSYNWLTTEMVNWPLPNGQTGQGVLYKPENFDPTKKYPVIFNYYERKSGWMYQFSNPAYSRGNMNIPWFVSGGYLVFTPDIPFSDGSKTGISSGEHAWLAVESAAAYLSKRSYIDSTRLGLQGNSFGGQLTLCIYTRSKRFAAAVEGTGFTDEMSTYLGLAFSGGDGTLETTPVQAERESHHALYGATPWEKPELYLKNSSVWRADQIGGPLLIMHNKKDDQVAWKQGVAMYMALRRLGKPCWMLQYDGEGHGVAGKAAKDYTIRMTQYFDHYLKGNPAPRWMTQGIPARFKQVENRYELDVTGQCNRDCQVCLKNK
jgi:dienelactone hydrolase